MADWTDPPWVQLVAGKAWTDEKAAAAFENPIAIAEGADDAPRIQRRALEGKRYLPGVAGSVAIVGLADVAELGGQLYFTASGGSNTCAIQFSTDGGSSWSSAQNLYSGGATTLDFLFSVRLDTGAWVWGAAGGTLTLPGGVVDAVRITASGAGASCLYQPIIEGGRA